MLNWPWRRLIPEGERERRSKGAMEGDIQVMSTLKSGRCGGNIPYSHPTIYVDVGKKMVVMMMMMIQWILFWGPIFFPSAIPVMNPIWILWQSFCPVARWEAIHPAFREPPSEPLMLFGEAGGRGFCCSFFAEHLGNTRGKGLKDLHKTPTHQKTIRIHN